MQKAGQPQRRPGAARSPLAPWSGAGGGVGGAGPSPHPLVFGAMARARRWRRALALGAVGALAALALAGGARGEGHTSNWAVLVCASPYWFNYRHMANTLSMYRTIKRLGVPDSHIVLFLADDVACNARNCHQGQVFNDPAHGVDLYGADVEVDYRGHEVTVENFLRVLTGRHGPAVPLSKRLNSDRNSNVFVFITGHGGDEFMKFQDAEYLIAQDVADGVTQMHEQRRYKELFLFVETCEAATMLAKVDSPGVVGLASSAKGEKSWSHGHDTEIGVAVVDQLTYVTLEFFEAMDRHSANATFADLLAHFRRRRDVIGSTVVTQSSLARPLAATPLLDFFGSVPSAIVTGVAPVPLRRRAAAAEAAGAEEGGAAGAEEEGARGPSSLPAFAEREAATREGLLIGLALLLAAAVSGVVRA